MFNLKLLVQICVISVVKNGCFNSYISKMNLVDESSNEAPKKAWESG